MFLAKKIAKASKAIWRTASNVEQLVAFWERIPAVVRAWIWAAIGSLVTALVQAIQGLPLWVLVATVVFGTPFLVLCYYSIGVLRRQRTLQETSGEGVPQKVVETEEEAAEKRRRQSAHTVRLVQRILPELPASQRDLLFQLLGGSQKARLADPQVHALKEAGMIQLIYRTGRSEQEWVVQLNPAIRDLVAARKDEEIDKGTKAVADSLSPEQRDALGLFTATNQDFQRLLPAPDSDGMFNLHMVLSQLANKRIPLVGYLLSRTVEGSASEFTINHLLVESPYLFPGNVPTRSINIDLGEVPAYRKLAAPIEHEP